MFDRWAMRAAGRPLNRGALYLKEAGYTPDQISVTAFCVGMTSVVALYLHFYWVALFVILVNRIGDGLDGALARMTETTDAGAYLDIVLDFVFYSAVVLGFGLASPEHNGLAAAVLLFTFVGTGGSFLAFAVMTERHGIKSIIYRNKGIYYLGGLAEGTETVLFFILACIFPAFFPILAYCFAGLCLITIITRVVGGYSTLRRL